VPGFAAVGVRESASAPPATNEVLKRDSQGTYTGISVYTRSEVDTLIDGVDVSQTLTAIGNMGAAQEVDVTGLSFVKVTGTLTANCTVNLIGGAIGTNLTLIVTQDGTGGRTLTLQDNGGATSSVPVDSTATTGVTKVEIRHNGTNYVVESSVQIQIPVVWTIQSVNGTSAITVGAGITKWIAPYAGTIVSARMANGAGTVTGDLIADINKNGTTIFTTQGNRPKVVSGDANGIGSVKTPDVTTFSAGDYFTVDLDAVNAADDEADDQYTIMMIVREG
jgi:hypothetical protein